MQKKSKPELPRKAYQSIDEYHADFPDAVRAQLDLMRETIRKVAPAAIEVISYNMPAFKQGKVLVYYAGYRHHIGFYPSAFPIRDFQDLLGDYKTSKGAIQFPMNKKLPIKTIQFIVKYRLKQLEGKIP
jgi:uncharacterized protein YdhG (YjbR/CyaY superfamily)